MLPRGGQEPPHVALAPVAVVEGVLAHGLALRLVPGPAQLAVKAVGRLDHLPQGSQGGLRQLRRPRAAPVQQRQGHGEGPAEASDHVHRADVRVLLGGLQRPAEARHDAGRGLGEVVVADVVCAWAFPGAAIAVQVEEYDLGVDLLERFQGDVERLQLRADPVEGDDVGPRHEARERLVTVWGAQVQQRALLPAHGQHAEADHNDWAVGWLGHVDLDDLGAEAAAQHADHGASDDVGQVKDLDALEVALACPLPLCGGRLERHRSRRNRPPCRRDVGRTGRVAARLG
mmetsp:Transcript_114149/g.323814  ORF Transcript_114149/g.323814 Transcript_114149/m.323814 type:complete len:287 (-) Transcript_114149:1378-2238(-)